MRNGEKQGKENGAAKFIPYSEAGCPIRLIGVGPRRSTGKPV